MRRGQAGAEAALVVLLLVLLVGAAAHAAAGAWQRSAAAVGERDARRGQAVVELLALCPLVAACACAFAIACARVTAVARAERELARAVRADVAGLGAAPAAGVRVLRDGGAIEVRVAAPLGDVVRRAPRVG